MDVPTLTETIHHVIRGRPFDIVHIAHTTYPVDARVRHETTTLAAQGWRVAIICLQYPPQEPAADRYGRVSVVRLRGGRSRGSPMRYLLEYVAFLIRAYWVVRTDRRFRDARVVHAHSLPDFLIAAGAPARRAGATLILDLHEIFPEFAREKFGRLLGEAAAFLARVSERWSRGYADVTITVNRPIAELLRSRPVRKEERIVVIHNAADADEFGAPQLTDGVVKRPLRLVYHGTLTRLYGVDLAIQAIQRARAEGLDVAFDIFGPGPQFRALSELVEHLDLDGVITLHGPVPHTTLRHQLPRFDAGFVPTRLDGMTKYSLSAKLLEYIHLGIPVLAPRIPTYLSYFPETAAWYYAPNDVASAAAAIHEFAAAGSAERVRRAREAQTRSASISWSRDAGELCALYRPLVEGPANGRRTHAHDQRPARPGPASSQETSEDLGNAPPRPR